MGHLSQIEAIIEAYNDILSNYLENGEGPLHMPKREVIIKQKSDFNYWAIHSGVCMPEIELEHEFERDAIIGLDDFIDVAHDLERLYKKDASPSITWLADEYVASLAEKLSLLAHTFGVLVPSLQDQGPASGTR